MAVVCVADINLEGEWLEIPVFLQITDKALVVALVEQFVDIRKRLHTVRTHVVVVAVACIYRQSWIEYISFIEHA